MSDGQHEGWHETRDRKYPPKPEPKKVKEEPATILLPVNQIKLVKDVTGMEGDGLLLYLLAEASRKAGLLDLINNPKSGTIRLDIMVSWVKEEEPYDHLPGIEDTGQGA